MRPFALNDIAANNFVEWFNLFQREAGANQQAHGFTGGHESVDVALSKIALMHTELSEATEAVRSPRADHHCPTFSNEEVELADCVIRIMSYAAARHLRVASALVAKMQFNATRPFKHGKEA